MKPTDDDIKLFHDNGYLIVKNAVAPEQLTALRSDFSSWVDESRRYNAPYGETIDSRPRFDV